MASKNHTAAASKSEDNTQTSQSTLTNPAVEATDVNADMNEAINAEGETVAAAEARKRAPAANFLPIVRGRLPLIFVHAVRFDDVIKAMSIKDVATKMGTSVGKIFDIRKNRNFAYVDASFKPTADDVAAANSWIEQVGDRNAKGISAQGDKALMTQLLANAQKGGLATAAEAAAFSAQRVASRPQRSPSASDNIGNVVNKLPGTEQVGSGATAESLLG